MATVQTPAKILNGVNVEDLFKTIGAIKATPAIAKFKFRIDKLVGGSQPKSLDRRRVLRRRPAAIAADAVRPEGG
jgi:hypothetical protein